MRKKSYRVTAILGIVTMSAWSISSDAKRPFRVQDAITASEAFSSDLNIDTIIPSPGGKRSVVVVRRGDPAKNINVYTLLLLAKSDREAAAHAEPIASFSTSSNRPGIDAVRWLDDTTVSFLGEAMGGTPQVMTLKVDTKALKSLTSETDVIADYAISPKRDVVLIDVRTRPDLTKIMSEGYLADRTPLHSLWRPDGTGAPYSQHSLRIVRNGQVRTAKLKGIDRTRWAPWPTATISPDGRYAVIALKRSVYPQQWWAEIEAAKSSIGGKAYAPGVNINGLGDVDYAMLQFHLVDLENGSVTPLQDLPTGIGISAGWVGAAWSPDSRRVLLANTYLPSLKLGALVVSIGPDRVSDPTTTFDNGQAGSFRSVAWNADGSATFRFGSEPASTYTDRTFRRDGSGWHETGHSTVSVPFVISETRDVPPEISWRAPDGKTTRITKLNDSLADVDLGHVEAVSWKDSKGRDNSGGLLMPPQRELGQRVPLVIYTHGDPGEYFWTDGPYHGMGYSTRALAAQGIAVLQVYDNLYDFSTPGEISSAVDRYALVVAKLAHDGLIDEDCVGIHTWSRTGFYLLDALLDGRIVYRAASASDADILSRAELTDAFMIPAPGMTDMEGLIGAKLWGEGAKVWAEREPINHLSKIHTPIRIETSGWRAAWWDAFTLLKRYGRPVEYYSFPDAEHSPIKPLERMLSQDGAVDWYAFWLLGHEDNRPEKAEQYRRWNAMRVADKTQSCKL